jgi:hypothetical protein
VPVYFRGKRVLDALLDELLTPAFGLADAEEARPCRRPARGANRPRAKRGEAWGP